MIMEIVVNVVKEKIRKKMLYITTILGILVVMLFSTDMGSLTIGGKNISDYYVLIPILINVVNFLAGAISLAMSITTIPNEYERRTSHLIWARGVGQGKYHISLAMGNVIVSWISGMILYLTLGVFAIANGYSNILGQIFVATLFMFIYTAIISVMTSALSIKLPAVVTGLIMIMLFVGGAFRSILLLVSAVLTGFGGTVVKRIIKLIPDLAGLSRQAGNLVQGKAVDAHVIIMGLVIIWIAGLGLIFFRRKEA